MRRLAAILGILLVLPSCSSTASPSPTGPIEPSPATGASSTPLPTATPRGTGSPSPTASATPGPTPTPAATPSAITGSYTVQPGDTLYRIAVAHGATVEQLVAWNLERYPSLAGDPSRIGAGWILVVAGSTSPPPPPAPPASAPPPAPPVAAGCRAGSRPAASGPVVHDRVPTDEHAVALTFDMGGRLEPGVEIMSWLVANGVCTTIFPTGVMAQTEQGRAVMTIIRAHPELFEVGNHTMYHCDLARGGGGSPSTGPCAGGPPSADRIRSELVDAAAIIRDATGQDPAPYWRPPYGGWNQAVIDAAASVGYPYTFMWDIDTVDWKPVSDGGPSAAEIASTVVSRAVAGSNVLMHLGGYETLAALPAMVQGLRDRGFTVTSLSDLLD